METVMACMTSFRFGHTEQIHTGGMMLGKAVTRTAPAF